MFENHVAKINGFKTFTKTMLLKPFVSSTLFWGMSTVNLLATVLGENYKTNSFSNTILGNVVKIMVFATLFLEML